MSRHATGAAGWSTRRNRKIDVNWSAAKATQLGHDHDEFKRYSVRDRTSAMGAFSRFRVVAKMKPRLPQMMPPQSNDPVDLMTQELLGAVRTTFISARSTACASCSKYSASASATPTSHALCSREGVHTKNPASPLIFAVSFSFGPFALT